MLIKKEGFGGNQKKKKIGQKFHCLLSSSIAIYTSFHVGYLLLVIIHPLFRPQCSGFQFNQICMHDVYKSQKDILVQKTGISSGQNFLTRSKHTYL